MFAAASIASFTTMRPASGRCPLLPLTQIVEVLEARRRPRDQRLNSALGQHRNNLIQRLFIWSPIILGEQDDLGDVVGRFED